MWNLIPVKGCFKISHYVRSNFRIKKYVVNVLKNILNIKPDSCYSNLPAGRQAR